MRWAILLLVLPLTAFAEFHIWRDSDGIRHVSTHPQSCFENGRVNTLRAGCAAWHLSAEQTRELKIERRQKQRKKQVAVFAKECEAIKAKRDGLSKGIRMAQASFNSRVLKGATDVDALNISLEEMINLPFKLSTMQAEMLAADKEYDKCVPESERARRRQARNEVRRKTAENARQAQQRNTLREMQNDLRDIGRTLRIY